MRSGRDGRAVTRAGVGSVAKPPSSQQTKQAQTQAHYVRGTHMASGLYR